MSTGDNRIYTLSSVTVQIDVGGKYVLQYGKSNFWDLLVENILEADNE